VSPENPKYSRRAVLKRLGLGAAFLPLLSTERARAANAGGFPTRFIAVTWTDGICPPSFYSTGEAGPLTGTLPATLQALSPWSSKVTLFRHASSVQSPFELTTMIDAQSPYGGHWSYPALLTGDVTVNGTSSTANAPSIDQIIANDLGSQGVNNALLNVGCRPFTTYTSWRGAKTPNTPQTDPYKLFNKFFSGGALSTAQMNALLSRRKSVLDYVGGELGTFSKKLGTDDRAKVQIHLDSIRSLEKQLASSTPPSASCTTPVLTPTGLNFNTVANYPNHVKFMTDLVAAAVICGKSRAVTLDLIDNGGGNSLTFPWLEIPSPDFHAIAHQGQANYKQKVLIDQWFYGQCVAALVAKLAAVPEGDGTVLDNTVILVCNDMSEGSFHFVGSIPYVMIGSAGGFFKTGRLVTFPDQVPNNKLLTSILHAMGITSAGVGPPKYAGDVDSALRA